MIVWKYAQNCAAQFCAIDEGGVTEFVEQDDVIFADYGRDRAERSGVSATETKRGFCSFPFGQHIFQTHMWRLCPADQPRGPSANPEFAERSDRCLAQSRIVGETEIIVRRKIDEPPPGDFDFRPLRAADFAKMSIQRACTERLQLLCKKIAHARPAAAELHPKTPGKQRRRVAPHSGLA